MAQPKHSHSEKPAQEGKPRPIVMLHQESQNRADDPWAQCLKQVAVARDQQAFAKLFDHFAPKIKAYGLSTQAQQALTQFAEELVQDVMLKVWHRAETFNPAKASVTTWVFTLARNCRIDLLRKAKKANMPLTAEDLWPEAVGEDEPYISLQEKRTQKIIKSALSTLPNDQAQVLTKAYMEGKSHAEIAIELDLPLGTVKSRIRLALQKLNPEIPR